MSTTIPGDSRHGGGKSGEPPNLASFKSAPYYDLATIVQLVGLRPMILWGWEQQLGIPAPTRLNDEVGAVRRYSEQDLVACIWLRDQILNGVSPMEAAARLRAAQRPTTGWDAWGDERPESRPGEDPLAPGRVNTGPLPNNSFMPPARAPKPTRPLSDLDAFPADPGVSFSGPAPQGPAANAAGSSYSRGVGPRQVWVSPLSGPLGQRIVSGPLGTPIATGPLGGAVAGPPAMSVMAETLGPLGPLGATPPHSSGTYENPSAQSGRAWVGTGRSATPAPARGRDPRTLLPQLIRALMNLDTEAANRVINEAMDNCIFEMLGSNLLQPAVGRIAELWAHHDITAPEEHFAMNYVRGLLYATFRTTPENPAGPLAVIGCAPRELDDLPALMLAVFWRRAGLRVVYLGQDVDGDSLVEEAHRRRPRLICLSASTSPRIRALARICKHLGQLDKPRPTFTFTGPVFARNPELHRKVAGVYLGDDAATATWHVTQLLGMDRR